jgi:hypothetical protein
MTLSSATPVPKYWHGFILSLRYNTGDARFSNLPLERNCGIICSETFGALSVSRLDAEIRRKGGDGRRQLDDLLRPSNATF